MSPFNSTLRTTCTAFDNTVNTTHGTAPNATLNATTSAFLHCAPPTTIHSWSDLWALASQIPFQRSIMMIIIFANFLFYEHRIIPFFKRKRTGPPQTGGIFNYSWASWQRLDFLLTLLLPIHFTLIITFLPVIIIYSDGDNRWAYTIACINGCLSICGLFIGMGWYPGAGPEDTGVRFVDDLRSAIPRATVVEIALFRFNRALRFLPRFQVLGWLVAVCTEGGC